MIFKLVFKKKTYLMKEKILNGSVKITAVDQKKLSYNCVCDEGQKYWCDNLLKAVYVGLLVSWVHLWLYNIVSKIFINIIFFSNS